MKIEKKTAEQNMISKDEIIKISNFLGLEDFTEYNIVRILRMGTYMQKER